MDGELDFTDDFFFAEDVTTPENTDIVSEDKIKKPLDSTDEARKRKHDEATLSVLNTPLSNNQKIAKKPDTQYVDKRKNSFENLLKNEKNETGPKKIKKIKNKKIKGEKFNTNNNSVSTYFDTAKIELLNRKKDVEEKTEVGSVVNVIASLSESIVNTTEKGPHNERGGTSNDFNEICKNLMETPLTSNTNSVDLHDTGPDSTSYAYTTHSEAEKIFRDFNEYPSRYATNSNTNTAQPTTFIAPSAITVGEKKADNVAQLEVSGDVCDSDTQSKKGKSKVRKKEKEVTEVVLKHVVKTSSSGQKLCCISVDLPKDFRYVVTAISQGRQFYSNVITPLGPVAFRRQYDLLKSEQTVDDICTFF